MAVGKNPSLIGESFGEAHGILEHTQAHPLGNQHLKGHNPFVGSEGRDRKGESQANNIFPSLTPTLHTPPQHSEVGCPAMVNTYGSAPYNITGVTRQRNMAQMKEQIKTPEKALAGMAQWVQCRPVNQRVTSLIPSLSQGTCLGCGPGPL